MFRQWGRRWCCRRGYHRIVAARGQDHTTCVTHIRYLCNTYQVPVYTLREAARRSSTPSRVVAPPPVPPTWSVWSQVTPLATCPCTFHASACVLTVATA